MKIIKYIDILGTAYDDEGNEFDIVSKKNVGIPEYIKDASISSISPYFTRDGRLYKNVSLITYEGQQLRVVGNYNDLNNRLLNLAKPVVGFYGKTKQREERIEDGTKVTRKIK
jgi:hypothetical protein